MNNNDLIHDPDDREIDMMLKYVPPYTDDNERNIKNKFEQRAKMRRRRISFKKMSLAAAAATMILVTAITALAFADVIDMSGIYRSVFGESSEYVEHYIEPLDDFNNANHVAHADHDNDEDTSLTEPSRRLQLTCEYDGIVIRLISAINDEHVLRIFAVVTDTTADRLDDSLRFPDWWLSKGYGGNISVIDYNVEAKTATVMLTSLGDHQPGFATLLINSLSTEYMFFYNLPESNINILELLNRESPSIISQDDVSYDGGGGEYELFEK